jgi:hypothetical protein
VHLVERHKDFFDLVIKAAGISVTIAGALWVAWKYFSDREHERRKTELDLRRKAYLDLFTAIPLQLDALRKFSADSTATEVSVPLRYYKALHRAHLLARHEAFRCIVRRNAMFHIGVMELVSIKRAAIQIQAAADAVNRDMTESVLSRWDDYWQRFRQLNADLGVNYRELLGFARLEIGLTDEMAPILEVLMQDEQAALAAWDRRT